MNYRYKNENFNPEQVKFLLDEDSNEIIGYCAVDLSDSEAQIEYPFIVEDYRTSEAMEFLFEKTLKFAKTQRNLVVSELYKQSYRPIIEFFNKRGAKKYESFDNYVIEVNKLNFEITPCKANDVNVNNLEKLENFIKHAKKPTESTVDKKYLEQRFKDGTFDSRRFKYIEKNGVVLGAIAASKEKVMNNTNGFSSRMNYYLIDLDDSNVDDIKVKLVGSLYEGLKEDGINRFIVLIKKDTVTRQIFEKLGFRPMNELTIRFKIQ